MAKHPEPPKHKHVEKEEKILVDAVEKVECECNHPKCPTCIARKHGK